MSSGLLAPSLVLLFYHIIIDLTILYKEIVARQMIFNAFSSLSVGNWATSSLMGSNFACFCASSK